MKKKNLLVVTGGAGFIGSSLIKKLIEETNYNILSLDNYFSGNKKNHVDNKRVKYIKGDTKNIHKILNKKKKRIKTIFHFGEFSRIVQSFEFINKLHDSNTYGTSQVIEFCRKNEIKIIYSATSAAFGNNFKDNNLSPYSYTKTFNLNLILNYHEWFGLSYEIIYFYNVYGNNQIEGSKMSAVIGLFKKLKKQNKPLTVVKPGTQRRHFTHIDETVRVVLRAFKSNKNTHYTISSQKSYSIIEIAKMLNHKYKFISERKGERFNSSFIKKIRNKKVINIKSKIDLKDYLKNI